MKLAVRKEAGITPMSGSHYMLMPMRMESDAQAEAFEYMGHIILDVTDELGERLLREAGAALRHQCEVAILTEKPRPQ